MALESLLIIIKQWCKGGNVSLTLWVFRVKENATSVFWSVCENWSGSRPVFWRLKKKIAVASCGLQVANINLYLIFFSWAAKNVGQLFWTERTDSWDLGERIEPLDQHLSSPAIAPFRKGWGIDAPVCYHLGRDCLPRYTTVFRFAEAP